MRTTTLALTAVLTTGLASPMTAQEEAPAPPQVLIVASFVCPMTTVADIARDYETYTKPVEQELVAEGALASAGLYFHAFADEWNVNHYRLGYDIGDMLDAMQTVNQRVVERNPEREGGAGPFAACTAHKDNIYGFGPGTGRPDVFTEENGGN
jgi:hypothetical protein